MLRKAGLLKGLKGFATFWQFSFYRQKKVANYEYHSLFSEKNHFILNFSFLMCSILGLFPQTWGLSTESILVKALLVLHFTKM